MKHTLNTLGPSLGLVALLGFSPAAHAIGLTGKDLKPLLDDYMTMETKMVDKSQAQLAINAGLAEGFIIGTVWEKQQTDECIRRVAGSKTVFDMASTVHKYLLSDPKLESQPAIKLTETALKASAGCK